MVQNNKLVYQTPVVFFPSGDLKTLWRPEYAAYMVEGTPGKPYGGLMAHLNTVEANMKLRFVPLRYFHWPIPFKKTLDTIGNCQRPVFSLGGSQHMHKITTVKV